jgi:hypothetical protein
MNKIFSTISLLFACLTGFSQTTLVDNPINYAQVKSIKEKSEAKAMTKDGITEYNASSGITIKIGDKFRINRPEGGAKTFVSIQNKPTVMDAFAMNSFNPIVNTSMSNTEITIKAFSISGTRKTGFKTFAELSTCGTCNNLMVDIELALETKEVRSNGMTKEDAISKLKEQKELLELGMITKEDYEKTKQELTPFIVSKS